MTIVSPRNPWIMHPCLHHLRHLFQECCYRLLCPLVILRAFSGYHHLRVDPQVFRLPYLRLYRHLLATI